MRLKIIWLLTVTILLVACIPTNGANRNFISSIKVNSFDDEEQYLSLVKLNASGAAEIAEKLDIGKVTSVELETEDGYLVYSVELVNNSDDKETEVLIDPVRGDILLIDEELRNNKSRTKH